MISDLRKKGVIEMTGEAEIIGAEIACAYSGFLCSCIKAGCRDVVSATKECMRMVEEEVEKEPTTAGKQ